MPYDPNGLISRWSGSARRGTLAHVGYALVALLAITVVLHRLIG
jgi:hypothetical protein